MARAETAAASPYKFLDPYELEDAPLFFGREREIRILLADIVVSRLVVLFARTGTGKTSLINAGVRPQLEERGYVTFFVRVDQDPVESARSELRTREGVRLREDEAFADQLSHLALDLDAPIVVFFDQFEEFFLYSTPESSTEFIHEIATCYDDPDSGVHFVFSMREDFFVEMDAFRDEIPTIFHNDSNLRLRNFDRAQARDAILGPATVFGGVELEDELVERVIADLAGEDGRVEPAQLQIVWDTLWEPRRDRIGLADYVRLGERRDASLTVAEAILDRRLEQRLGELRTREDLELVADILPLLRTKKDTKRVRTLAGLAEDIGVSEQRVDSVLRHLERSGLVRVVHRTDQRFVELTHDYLVRRLDDLAVATRLLWPRRVLAEAMASPEQPLPSEVLELLDRADELSPTPAEAEFLFRAALASGVHLDSAVTLRWKLDVWAIFRDVLCGSLESDRLTAALSAVRLLGEKRAPEAMPLLVDALSRPELTSAATDALAQIGSPEAVATIARTLPADHARRALLTVVQAQPGSDAAGDATDALLADLRRAIETRVGGEEAIGKLERLEVTGSVDLLEQALGVDDLAPAARDALLELSRSSNGPVAERAAMVLTTSLTGLLDDEMLAGSALQVLGRIPWRCAVDALEEALGEPRLAPEAEKSLLRLERATRTDVAAAARDALAQFTTRAASAGTRVAPAAPPGAVVKKGASRSSGTAPYVVQELQSHFSFVAHQILAGRVVPILGGGASAPFAPTGPELARLLVERLGVPDEYDVYDLPTVAEYVEAVYGPSVLTKELERLFPEPLPPTPVHRLLASIPGLVRERSSGPEPLVVFTLMWDRGLERAFDEAGEQYDVLAYTRDATTSSPLIVQPWDADAVPLEKESARLLTERPLIVKLLGSIGSDTGVAATPDDFVSYPHRLGPQWLSPRLQKRLVLSSRLHLGLRRASWTNRVVLRMLEGDSQFTRRASWAVLLHPDELEARLWQRDAVEVVDCALEDYVEGLADALRDPHVA